MNPSRRGPLSAPPLSLLILLFGLIGAQLLVSGPFALDANAAPLSSKEFKIVIDPGHGGTDFGAITGKGKDRFTEKEATLKLAIEAQRQLLGKGYPVILTRSRDADIALNARTAIANREHAKLFISLHMNSTADGKSYKEAEGVETYIFNSASDNTSKRLAELENKGLDPTQGSQLTRETEVNLILKDLTLDSNLPESKRLACSLQKHLVSVTGQKHRGVKQAMFVVLLGADMPSVLLEAGFVSSPRDRKLYSSPHGVRAVAAALVRAVEQFRREAGTDAARAELSSCLVHGQG